MRMLVCYQHGGKLLVAGKSSSATDTDISVIVPETETETYKVQELHLPIYHSWCLALEKDLFGQAVT
jgi:D-sedoheptulose 7-phosphate isomerase